jgi:hypothetical protein
MLGTDPQLFDHATYEIAACQISESEVPLVEWRTAGDFPTALCVSAPVQAQLRPQRRANRPDLTPGLSRTKCHPVTTPTDRTVQTLYQSLADLDAVGELGNYSTGILHRLH